MDVTCERCGTRYEFDEALVSARGTTVKCTSCGHQFKVYRPQGAPDLDGWLVRTLDGRELVFTAMRELQAAISSGQIAPDDVLIPRSGGAPRRLGRIEELQSFFAQSDREAVTERHARRPATGYAFTRAPSAYAEHKGTLLGGTHAPSAAAAAGLAERAAPRPAAPPDHDKPRRTGNTLRPPTGVPQPMVGSIPPDAATIPRSPGLPTDFSGDGRPNLRADRLHSRDVPSDDDAYDDAPATPRRHDGSVAMPLAKASQHGREEAVEALERAVEDALGDVSARSSNRGAMALDDLPSISDDDTLGEAALAETALAETALAETALAETALGEASSSEDAIEEAPPSPRVARPSSSRPPRISEPPSSNDARISVEPATPTPSAARPSMLRSSEVYSDPRFSGYARGRRPGIARWVIGIVGLGLVTVIGFTVFKKELAPEAPPTATATTDTRVDAFLAEGERRLHEGDVEGAQEQFVKASAVAEGDPRVARALARTAVVRADLLWLHKQLTRDGTPHHQAIAHQLEGAVTRARRAADAAVARAPDDPIAASIEVDVLRLEGRIDEARKRVSKLEGAGPDGARALAALDLTEESPSYGTVLDRLRTATRAERKLGRAHAMLVFALVRAGKLDDAKKELSALEGETPGHALLAVLRHRVEGTEPPEEPPPPAPATAAPPPPPPPAYNPRPEPFATAEPDAPPPPAPTSDPGDDPPPPAPPPPPSDLPPEIDVSDLPEYH